MRVGRQRRLSRLNAAVLVVLASGAGAQAVAQDAPRQVVALDRWLVSSPFPADTTGGASEVDYLAAPGEVAVLPDRERTVAGADWTLVRRDSQAVLDLEDQRGDTSGPVVVYAHAYIRSTEDRTIQLSWEGVECTEVDAWLNGRPLAGLEEPHAARARPGSHGPFEALVRIGHGYNTLLLKALSGDCRFGVAASISGPLEGVRVQASRPYGDTRTGPAPWLISDPDAGPEPVLAWKEDELFGAAGVRLTAFAVTAIEGARLKAKVGGEEVKREISWLPPAEPETVLMPFAFKTLHRAVVRESGLELELDWRDGESEGTLRLDPAVLLEALHSRIVLLGWTVTEGGAQAPASADAASIFDEDDEPHPLANLIAAPSGAGTTLVGEWEVPGWLSGFTLQLDTEGAPGEYRLDSRPVDGSPIVLCAECRKGERVQIVVSTTGQWDRFPAVSIAGLEAPAVQDTQQATEWLGLLDEKGSRQYRERAGETR